MKRVSRGLRVIRLRGPHYLPYLVHSHLAPRLGFWLLEKRDLLGRKWFLAAAISVLGLFALLTIWILGPQSGLMMAVLLILLTTFGWGTARILSHRHRRTHLARPSSQGHFTSFADWDIPEASRTAIAKARAGSPDLGLVLGHIDNDGRLLSRFGELPGFELVRQADFVPRYRYSLDLVLIGDRVLIRKDFRGDRRAFHREWLALASIRGDSNAPGLHEAQKNHLVLTKNFVPGATLRSLLVSAGARILTVDTQDDPELSALAPQDRTEAVWARGRDRFGVCLESGFLDQLEELLDILHLQGITGFSLTFGNVVRHSMTGEPWVIDFDGAETHTTTQSIRFEQARDKDRELFNRIYGQHLVTRREAARVLKEELTTNYAPIDLGMGLATPGFWSVDSGTGRWEYLNGRVLTPLLQGRRILDLGSHNGIMPLMMLRAGAREVVAVERSPELVEAVKELKRLVEWRDMRHYDLHLHCADMLDVLTEDWGAFDLVTAFCSLYYLNEDDMRRVVQRAAELAPILVLQAKIDTRDDAADDKAKKSSLHFFRQLVVSSGFGSLELSEPRGYSRPIIVARNTDWLRPPSNRSNLTATLRHV